MVLLHNLAVYLLTVFASLTTVIIRTSLTQLSSVLLCSALFVLISSEVASSGDLCLVSDRIKTEVHLHDSAHNANKIWINLRNNSLRNDDRVLKIIRRPRGEPFPCSNYFLSFALFRRSSDAFTPGHRKLTSCSCSMPSMTNNEPFEGHRHCAKEIHSVYLAQILWHEKQYRAICNQHRNKRDKCTTGQSSGII